MLQQTVIKAVLPIYERFLTQFPTPATLAQAHPEDIRLAVRGLGYYRRFDLLHKACRKVASENRGLPVTYNDWLELPGIGTYTASAIASITKDLPHGVVDGNVERVLCRFLDIRTEPNLPHLKKQFKKIMDDICALGNSGAFNQAVMELGQTVCTPSSPSCGKCPIKSKCQAYENSSQALAPAAKAQIKPIDVYLSLEITTSANGVHLVKRPADAKFLKETWGFKTWIGSGEGESVKWVRDGSETNKRTKTATKSLGSIKHSITKHKIIADVMTDVISSTSVTNAPSDVIKIVGIKDVEKHLVSNLDRKAWILYLKKSFSSEELEKRSLPLRK